MRITPEEHKSAIETPEGMRTLFTRMVAHCVIALLQGVAPVIQESVMQGVPTAYRIAAFMEKHGIPESEHSRFYALVEKTKKAEPSLPLDTALQRALEGIKDDAG